MTKKEQVLVFPETRLEPYLHHFEAGNGIVTDRSVVEDVLDDVLAPAATRFMDRAAAETDPRFKQVIPYCVLTCLETGDGGYVVTPFHRRYFVYFRTSKGGEKRLYGRASVGVGGHINPCDELPQQGVYGSSFPMLYDCAVRRELQEEVGLTLGPDLGMCAPVIALIYDPSDAVGQVHFGVVHAVPADPAAVKTTDPALADGFWDSLRSLCVDTGALENWSRLVVTAGCLAE